MPTVIIGGHTRNIGKSALVADIIAALPEARWTAVKITLYGHRFCSDHAGGCDCAPRGRAVALDEETDRTSGTDTARFLAAGAARSLWLRARKGHLAEGLPELRGALAGAVNVIVESNSLLGLLRPALYLVVLDPGQADFKPSARQFLDLADAVILRAPLEPDRVAWPHVPRSLLERLPSFPQPLGAPLPAGVLQLVRSRLAAV
jgi:hypothetical protein